MHQKQTIIDGQKLIKQFDDAMIYYREIKQHKIVKELQKNKAKYIEDYLALTTKTANENAKYFVFAIMGE